MAPGIRDILYYMVHIEEFRAIIQWYVALIVYIFRNRLKCL